MHTLPTPKTLHSVPKITRQWLTENSKNYTMAQLTEITKCYMPCIRDYLHRYNLKYIQVNRGRVAKPKPEKTPVPMIILSDEQRAEIVRLKDVENRLWIDIVKLMGLSNVVIKREYIAGKQSDTNGFFDVNLINYAPI